MQWGEIKTRKEKGTLDGKGKRKGKAKENGKAMEKGKGKGNSKGKGIVKQTPGGDDISRAVALQLQKEMYEADSDMEGKLEWVNLSRKHRPPCQCHQMMIPTLPSRTANITQNIILMWICVWKMMWTYRSALI